MSELAKLVFASGKLHRYVSLEERQHFLRQLASTVEFVVIVQIVRQCRDPKDDKFLEVALNGRADVIITGDAGGAPPVAGYLDTVPREILEELKIGLLCEQKFLRPQLLDRVPQLRCLLELKPLGRLAHVAFKLHDVAIQLFL